MSWNHRILARKYEDEIYLEIHEVHYDEKGNAEAYAEKPTTIGSETLKGITWTLNKMKECRKKPILWYGEKFPKEYKLNNS